MHTKYLISIFSLFIPLAGCDSEQDLGETASSSGGAESSGTTSGSAETGVLDTGPDDTGIPTTGDGTTSGGTTGGSAETGVLDTGPWSGSDSSGSDSSGTGEPPGDCAEAEQFITWNADGLAPEVLGFGGTFVGVGSCAPQLLPPEGNTISLALECTLSGTRDGTDYADEDISITLSFETTGDVELPPLWPSVNARFFVGSPGFEQASARYFVLEQPMLPTDGDAPVILGSRGFAPAPNAAQFDTWYPGEWFNGPGFTTADASCTTGDAPECGYDVAVRAGWLDEAPIDVHGREAGTFGAPTEGGSYDLYVETAWEAPESFKCGEDFPGADYRFVALGATAQ